MRAIFLTTPDLIGLHWWSVATLLDPAVRELSRGEWTTTDLAAMVDSGRAFSVLALEGDEPVLAMVFEFRHYPARMTVNVMALAGRNLAEAAMTFWPQFVAWTKESGASGIEACAGAAMTRVLRALGFEHQYNLLRIEV